MMAILSFSFWRTDARYKPGFLFGLAAIIYGLSRFAVEFVREPDVQLGTLSWGLTMGQTLTIPMLLAGVWLVATAKGRRQRIRSDEHTSELQSLMRISYAVFCLKKK